MYQFDSTQKQDKKEKTMLKRLGIVKSRTKGYKVFNEHIEPNFFNNTMAPNEYVLYCWNKYITSGVSRNNALNGTVFELIIASLLVKEGVVPLYLQANVAFVPNINFDAIVYSSENGPISLSLKTSLRERYKQADLEAIALKYVHRKSKSYLLTIDASEARSVKEKIKNGYVMGLDDAILATSPSFNSLIDELHQANLINPGSVDILTAEKIITSDRVTRILGTTT